jgi:hypothetical protein
MADWATISSLATAAGTLVLATATFASVRSSNRSARAAERTVLAGIRPLIVTSGFDDAMQKVSFVDAHWVRLGGGLGTAEVIDGNVYLAVSLRNAGNGIAVLDRWDIRIGDAARNESHPGDPATFRRLTRDIYIPAHELGFWQGAFRDPGDPAYRDVVAAVTARQPIAIDLLYGDYEGGQHTISRFSILPRAEGEEWLATVSRHWNLDRDDPR